MAKCQLPKCSESELRYKEKVQNFYKLLTNKVLLPYHQIFMQYQAAVILNPFDMFLYTPTKHTWGVDASFMALPHSKTEITLQHQPASQPSSHFNRITVSFYWTKWNHMYKGSDSWYIYLADAHSHVELPLLYCSDFICPTENQHFFALCPKHSLWHKKLLMITLWVFT